MEEKTTIVEGAIGAVEALAVQRDTTSSIAPLPDSQKRRLDPRINASITATCKFIAVSENQVVTYADLLEEYGPSYRKSMSIAILPISICF